jgi:Plant transposon protein
VRGGPLQENLPGATNDQTITKYDDFLNSFRKREIYENVIYEIIDDVGETKTDIYRSICNILVGMVGSLRKDVECLFGIMKSSFRILRNPVSFHTIEDLQNVMFCCCILHNLLLSADDLDTAWEYDVAWDALDPDADLDGEEMVVPVPPVLVDVIPSVAIPLVQDVPTVCQISSICKRNYTR